MADLFPCRAFNGFGPSLFAPEIEIPAPTQVFGARPASLGRQIKVLCGPKPGVYGMLGEHGELLYVGKAKSLRARLMSYFRPRSRDRKAGRIIQHARSIVWERCPSEFSALLRELELIRRWRPRYNVQGQPGRRRPTFLCVGRRPVPHLFVARTPPAGALAVYGPLAAGPSLREAVRLLNDFYRLRDCPKPQTLAFADQASLFREERTAGCLRYDLGTCLGPCIAASTRGDYMEGIRAACQFLDGDDTRLLAVLERKMEQASLALAFEEAARLRDRHAALARLRQRLHWLRVARHKHSFVYPDCADGASARWYLIERGSVRAVLPRPVGPAREEAARRIRLVYGLGGAPHAALAADELDSVLLVALWFQRYPDEKRKLLTPAEALHFCERQEA